MFGDGSIFSVSLIVALAIVAAVLIYGYSTRCKACHRWFALRKVERKLLYQTKTEKRFRTLYQCRFCKRKQGFEKSLSIKSSD